MDTHDALQDDGEFLRRRVEPPVGLGAPAEFYSELSDEEEEGEREFR
jgi:hypothetical protein